MDGFARKLDFVLRALSLSRGQLGKALGADKSVVSRWLAGARAPTANNLSAITALVAAHVPGFTMLDWDLPLETLAERLGPPVTLDADEILAFALVKTSTAETRALGGRFVGLWRSTRASFTQGHSFIREHLLIEPAGDRLAARLFTVHFSWPGWVLINNQRLDVLVEDFDLVHMRLAPPSTPVVHAMDGLVMTSAADEHRTPSATRVYLERVSPTGASAAAVATMAAAALAEPVILCGSTIEPALARHLLPDFGPGAEAAGGERVLRMPRETSMARGAFYG